MLDMNRLRTLFVVALALCGCTVPDQGSDLAEQPRDLSAGPFVRDSQEGVTAAGATASAGEPGPALHEGRAKVWFAAAIAGVGEARPEGRWGYADAEGEIVVPARFQAAGDFADGRALVLLDDVYTFIDTTGATVAPLVQAGEIAPLPAVPSGCSELACYVAALGGEVDTWSIVANPGRGEELLELEVRKLGYGAVEVRERGWEGSSHVLVLPGRAPEDASVLLKALLRDVAMRDVSQDGIFPGDIATWQLDATEAAAEFYGIRVRGAGVEIHHTVWES